MASFNNKIMTLTAILGVMLLSTVTSTQAQGLPSCAQKLLPCANYLNTTTTPPATCCDSVKEAVNNERPCLCNLANNPSLLQSLNINVTKALEVADRCGVNADLSSCASAESPTAVPPPGVPGNDGTKIAKAGFSSLFLIWAASLFY